MGGPTLSCPFCRMRVQHRLVAIGDEMMAWCQSCFRVRLIPAMGRLGGRLELVETCGNGQDGDMTDDIMGRARALLVDSASWHDFRRRLDDADITPRLSVAALNELLAAWHACEAGAMTDQALAEELGFWANGGTYDGHLRGYNAVPPAVLVAQARDRGWFVKPLGSGGVIINAPSERPMVVRGLVE